DYYCQSYNSPISHYIF
nr:immunoglobulin light chain junction region [Macaca mulatta]